MTQHIHQTSESLSDPLAGGFYTVAEAARLLQLGSAQRVVRWLSGSEPVVLRQYEKVGRQHEIGFLDLLEIRFIEHFRARGLSLQSLRRCAQNARTVLKVDHPFATSNVRFQSDRKRVFLDTAEEMGDRKLLDLMVNQYAIVKFIEDTLARDLEFDVSGLAREWRPRPDKCPAIIINPLYAFGRPVVGSEHVPTTTVLNLFEAENGNKSAVAKWFGITEEEADQAVRFELGLATA